MVALILCLSVPGVRMIYRNAGFCVIILVRYDSGERRVNGEGEREKIL